MKSSNAPETRSCASSSACDASRVDCGIVDMPLRSVRSTSPLRLRNDWYCERWYSVEYTSGWNAGCSASPIIARCSSAVRWPMRRAAWRYAPMRSFTASGASSSSCSENVPFAGRSGSLLAAARS